MNTISNSIELPTIDQLLALASRHGLVLQKQSFSYNESGLDFQVVFALDQTGTPWVLRLPRRRDVDPRAAYEKRVLTLVHKYLSVAVPEWKINTGQLIAYPRLPGKPAATIDPEAKQYRWYLDPANVPDAFVNSFSRLLVDLHAINPHTAASNGLRVKHPEEIRKALQEKMEKVQQAIGVSQAHWQRWQEWLSDDSYWPQHTVLVHGDLHAGHILVDTDFTVSGVIDWTEAEVDDPAIDFVPYLATFGEAALDVLLARYQQAGGKVWPRMKDHILQLQGAYAINIALFALQSGIDEYLQMAKAALA